MRIHEQPTFSPKVQVKLTTRSWQVFDICFCRRVGGERPIVTSNLLIAAAGDHQWMKWTGQKSFIHRAREGARVTGPQNVGRIINSDSIDALSVMVGQFESGQLPLPKQVQCAMSAACNLHQSAAAARRLSRNLRASSLCLSPWHGNKSKFTVAFT